MIRWGGLRLITIIIAALVGPISQTTRVKEMQVLWLPDGLLNTWFEKTILAPWFRWDALWYLRIVQKGYHLEDGTAQFHPLYPWISALLYNVGISPLLILMLISSLASLLLWIIVERHIKIEAIPTSGQTLALLLFTFPVAFILFAPYSESLFLLFSLLCILYIQEKSWWLAGFTGMLATLTRQQGILLILPMVWEVWKSRLPANSNSIFSYKRVIALLLIPAGWGIWLAYRAIALGDWQPDFQNLHSLVYSIFISPSSEQVVAGQTFTWPWIPLGNLVVKFFYHPEIETGINLGLTFWLLVLFIFSWKGMRASSRIYTTAITLVSLCYYTGPVNPVMGLPRHLFLAFPFIIEALPPLRSRWMNMLIISCSLVGMAFLFLMYFLEVWIP